MTWLAAHRGRRDSCVLASYLAAKWHDLSSVTGLPRVTGVWKSHVNFTRLGTCYTNPFILGPAIGQRGLPAPEDLTKGERKEGKGGGAMKVGYP